MSQRFNIPGKPETFRDHGAPPMPSHYERWDMESKERNYYPPDTENQDDLDDEEARREAELDEAARLGQNWSAP